MLIANGTFDSRMMPGPARSGRRPGGRAGRRVPPGGRRRRPRVGSPGRRAGAQRQGGRRPVDVGASAAAAQAGQKKLRGMRCRRGTGRRPRTTRPAAGGDRPGGPGRVRAARAAGARARAGTRGGLPGASASGCSARCVPGPRRRRRSRSRCRAPRAARRSPRRRRPARTVAAAGRAALPRSRSQARSQPRFTRPYRGAGQGREGGQPVVCLPAGRDRLHGGRRLSTVQWPRSVATVQSPHRGAPRRRGDGLADRAVPEGDLAEHGVGAGTAPCSRPRAAAGRDLLAQPPGVCVGREQQRVGRERGRPAAAGLRPGQSRAQRPRAPRRSGPQPAPSTSPPSVPSARRQSEPGERAAADRERCAGCACRIRRNGPSSCPARAPCRGAPPVRGEQPQRAVQQPVLHGQARRRPSSRRRSRRRSASRAAPTVARLLVGAHTVTGPGVRRVLHPRRARGICGRSSPWAGANRPVQRAVSTAAARSPPRGRGAGSAGASTRRTSVRRVRPRGRPPTEDAFGDQSAPCTTCAAPPSAHPGQGIEHQLGGEAPRGSGRSARHRSTPSASAQALARSRKTSQTPGATPTGPTAPDPARAARHGSGGPPRPRRSPSRNTTTTGHALGRHRCRRRRVADGSCGTVSVHRRVADGSSRTGFCHRRVADGSCGTVSVTVGSPAELWHRVRSPPGR